MSLITSDVVSIFLSLTAKNTARAVRLQAEKRMWTLEGSHYMCISTVTLIQICLVLCIFCQKVEKGKEAEILIKIFIVDHHTICL